MAQYKKINLGGHTVVINTYGHVTSRLWDGAMIYAEKVAVEKVFGRYPYEELAELEKTGGFGSSQEAWEEIKQE